MSTLAKARQSAVTGKIPTPYQLAFGELAINTTDGVLYFKKTNGITEKIVKLNASEDGVAPIELGGTGSTTAVEARVALGLGTVATQDSDAVAISGGTIDGTPVGATTKSTGGFTDVAMTGMLNAHAPLTTDGYQFSVTNESTRPNSWAAYRVGNAPSDSDSLRIGALGKSFTTTGAYLQDAGFIEAGGNLSGGLSVIASASAANFRLYLGGYAATNLRLQIATNGIITGSASTGLLAYIHVLTNANVGQAYSCFYVANGATSADGTGVLTCGTAFATSGVYVQNGGVLEAGANLSGGLGIMARHASGNMRFYTGGYMVANERMRIDASGLVGIGAASSGARLQVTGTTIGSDATVLVKNTGSAASTFGSVEIQSDSTAYLFSRTYSLATASASFGVPLGGYSLIATSGAASLGMLLGTTTATPLVLGTNSTSRMSIDATGKVGIGAAPNPSTLTVAGNVTLNDGGFCKSVYYNAGWKYSASAGGLGFALYGGSTGLYLDSAPASGVVDAVATMTTRMFIDANGNVNFGGISPTAKLSITGDSNHNVASFDTYLRVLNGGSNSNYFGWNVYGTSTADSLLPVYSGAASATWFVSGQRDGGSGPFVIRGGNHGVAATGIDPWVTGDTIFSHDAITDVTTIGYTGKVGINSTAPPVSPSAGAAGMLTLERSSTYVPICAYAYANSVSGGGMLVLGKSRSTVKGTMAETLGNDALGYVTFEGVTTALALASPAAYIQGTQDGASGAVYVPGRLDFYTGTNAVVASHRMTVTSNGVGIGLGANVAPRSTLSLGLITSTPSTAPTNIDLGGSHSSVAGANLKLRLWTDGTQSYGIGISPSQMDYVVQSQASHAWWRGALKTMILDTGDRLLIGVAAANANGGVLQLKSGITFPATQVAATDPNTLDDYEEGTFTPAFSCASPGTLAVTYTNQVGRYTKVGRLVTYTISMKAATLTVGTATGALYITGMPFQSLTLGSYVAPAATLLYGLTGAASTPMSAWIGNATTIMRITTNGASAFVAINITDITVPTAEIYISGQYEV